MKILLDEQLSGSKAYYQALGWNPLTVQDVGLTGKDDVTVARYALENDFFLITKDVGMADVAQLLNLKYFLISEAWIVKMVDSHLRTMKGN